MVINYIIQEYFFSLRWCSILDILLILSYFLVKSYWHYSNLQREAVIMIIGTLCV